MKLKTLEEYLGQLDGFDKPKWQLEQYTTQPHIASHILHSIESRFNDLEDKLVVDLGCGCGHLSIGAALMGAGQVFAYDIDRDALDILQCNSREMEVDNVEPVLADVPYFLPRGFRGQCDTVIMNPPFGTSVKGIDVAFLKVALALTKNSVYSLHKSSTREHILLKARQFGAEGEVLAQLRFDLPASYKFHKKRSVDIEVDFVRFALN